jgi:hypothetical protein
MLSGRKKKDYDAETAADGLAAQATALGETADGPSIPATEPIPEEVAAA